MEANDQEYMYKIVFSIDWILSWLESTTILDTEKSHSFPPGFILVCSSQLWSH